MSLISASKQSQSRKDIHNVATTAVELELHLETDVVVIQEPIATRKEGVLHTFSGYMHSGEPRDNVKL